MLLVDEKDQGPFNKFFTRDPEYVVKDRKDGNVQQTINSAVWKKLREKACTEIARWLWCGHSF